MKGIRVIKLVLANSTKWLFLKPFVQRMLKTKARKSQNRCKMVRVGDSVSSGTGSG
jgi:hypothetical protein